jgi:hypothetical protein
MPQSTKAELQKKFDALQQDYQQKLDDIFSTLYDRLEELEPQMQPTAATEPQPAPVTPPSTPEPQPEPKPQPRQAPIEPQQPVLATPSKKWKLPTWRDTWRYQGLKGLASRVWRGTNPEQDAAWRYNNESILPHLTLEEYLIIKEATDEFVNYFFVIEEALRPEVAQAFTDAKNSISKLVLNFLKKSHDLGIKIGDLVASTKYMFPPKQQSLFDKGKAEQPTQSPEMVDQPKETQPKAVRSVPEKITPEKPVIENPTQEQSDILEGMVGEYRFKQLKPFEPWTWFAWASKPTKQRSKGVDLKDALLTQWREQAGNKFTSNLKGLTNLLTAVRNGWFGDTLYNNDSAVARRIGELLGRSKVNGRPWSDFMKLGQFASQSDADMYLSKQMKPIRSGDAPDKGVEEPVAVKPKPKITLKDPVWGSMF